MTIQLTIKVTIERKSDGQWLVNNVKHTADEVLTLVLPQHSHPRHNLSVNSGILYVDGAKALPEDDRDLHSRHQLSRFLTETTYEIQDGILSEEAGAYVFWRFDRQVTVDFDTSLIMPISTEWLQILEERIRQVQEAFNTQGV